MTPEEAAVINAAIELRRQIPGRDVRQRITLEEATWKLITTCNDCNHDTHTCPGCGTWVPHAGSGVCPGCQADMDGVDQSPPLWAPSAQERQRQPEMQWVLRTWQDVRTGDTVRMPGTEVTAVIEMRYLHPSQDPEGKAWHIVAGRTHWDNHAVQLGECVVQLAGEGQPRFMNPVAPVEIELTAEDIRVAELLGWENRL